MSCFDLTHAPVATNSRLCCCYRAREHVDPAWFRCARFPDVLFFLRLFFFPSYFPHFSSMPSGVCMLSVPDLGFPVLKFLDWQGKIWKNILPLQQYNAPKARMFWNEYVPSAECKWKTSFLWFIGRKESKNIPVIRKNNLQSPSSPSRRDCRFLSVFGCPNLVSFFYSGIFWNSLPVAWTTFFQILLIIYYHGSLYVTSRVDGCGDTAGDVSPKQTERRRTN